MIQLSHISNYTGSKRVSLKDHDAVGMFGGYTNDSGIEVNEKRALMHTGIFRGITLLGGAIAGLPKHLFQRSSGDENRDRRVAHEHPGHRLIYTKPNRVQNSFQYHFMAITHLLLWGNFYAHIRRNRFYEPVSIVPIMPWCCDPFVKNGRKYFRVGGEVYKDNEIMHVYGLSLNGVKGIKPIQYMAESIGIGLAAQKMEASSFGKGMHAGGMIELGEEWAGIMGSTDDEAKEELEEFRKSFRKQYQDGPDSWHNILMMEEGMKFTQFEMAFQIEKLIANKKFTLADVARILGVPLHKLMEMDRSTFNNIEEQNIDYVQDGVMPLTINLEQANNDKLLKESEKDEYFYKYNLDGLRRANIKDRYEAYSIALGKNAPGWMEPKEIRELEDLNQGNPENWATPQNMEINIQRD